MRDLQLLYRGLAIGVEGADGADCAWLREFLGPAFAARDGGALDCAVRVVHDATALGDVRARSAHDATGLVSFLALDRGPLRLPAWAAADGTRLVVHDDARLAYRVAPDRRRVEVLSSPNNPALRTALMKVVRELAMSAAWSADSLVLHAAACAVGEHALLIAGPKRAGKSSLLLHALRARGVRLLSNDRVVVEHYRQRATAHGMPTIVSLRPGTVEQLCASATDPAAIFRCSHTLTIAEAAARARPDDLAVRALNTTPAQLGYLLGVELIGHATPTALVLPRVDPDARGIVLRRIDADCAADRLSDVLFGAALPPHVSEVLVPPQVPLLPGEADLRRLWRRIVERLRVFECRLGPTAYATDPAAAFVAPVLQD